LRAELIEQGRKMNELRQTHDKAVAVITHQLTSKFDSELLKADSEFKAQVAKLLAEANLKESRIRQLEKNEKRAIQERDKHIS
jgi:F420-0:gamma-glutamyl ligase